MHGASPKPDVRSVDDIAQILSQIVDVGLSPYRAAQLTDDMSELLWAVTDLDPDGEQLLKHSSYVADIFSQSPD